VPHAVRRSELQPNCVAQDRTIIQPEGREFVSNQTNAELNVESGSEKKPESESQRNPSRNTDKREKLALLRALYVEAQKLAVRGQPHENLDWILGNRRDLAENPLGFQTKTIELISLWLEDLIAELESPQSDPKLGETESSALSAYQTRYAAAQTLRDATRVFLTSFRSLPTGETVEKI
jgi:hypothetical protein